MGSHEGLQRLPVEPARFSLVTPFTDREHPAGRRTITATVSYSTIEHANADASQPSLFFHEFYFYKDPKLDSQERLYVRGFS